MIDGSIAHAYWMFHNLFESLRDLIMLFDLLFIGGVYLLYQQRQIGFFSMIYIPFIMLLFSLSFIGLLSSWWVGLVLYAMQISGVIVSTLAVNYNEINPATQQFLLTCFTCGSRCIRWCGPMY